MLMCFALAAEPGFDRAAPGNPNAIHGSVLYEATGYEDLGGKPVMIPQDHPCEGGFADAMRSVLMRGSVDDSVSLQPLAL